ncbi:MAG: ABC transporter permease [Clostridia bacterium]|nr:ABC transporter permease [Clostridia bacterium]
MNIYLREMKAYRKSLLFWCLGILFMVGAGLGKYAAFNSSDKQIYQLLDSMPKPVLAMFGMVGIDISTASGFYGIIYVMLLIMGSIHAAMLGASIISKEERDKTSEFLFVKPVSRVKIITSKILAALTQVVIFNVATLVSSIGVGMKVAQDPDLTRDIVVLCGTLFIIQVIFLFVGTAMASITKKPAASAGAATTIVLVTYFLSVLIDLTDKLSFLKYFTPYKYFEAKAIIHGGSLETVYVLISGVLVIVFVGVTYTFFPRRDLAI